MKVAVDTRLLLKNRMDGLGLFTEGSFKHIVTQHPKINFIFIFDRAPHTDFIFGKNVTTKVIGPQARHPFLYMIWYGFSLKRLLKTNTSPICTSSIGTVLPKS